MTLSERSFPVSGSTQYQFREGRFFPSFEIVGCDTVEQAAKDCPIITTFTRAKEPFLTASMVAKGTHINAGGAIIPTNAEIAQDVFKRCDKIVCDNLAPVQKGSRELMEYVQNGGSWDKVIPICNLVRDQKPRPAGADITIYKFMGMGLADMASASTMPCVSECELKAKMSMAA